jgi:hypothetical protein
MRRTVARATIDATEEVDMAALETHYEALSERVDGIICSHRSVQPLLATTPQHHTIRELVARTEGLEQAVREIAREVEELAVRMSVTRP